MNSCAICKSNFSSVTSLDVHVNDTHRAMSFIDIGNAFTSMNQPIPNSVAQHLSATIKCNICGMSFRRTNNLKRHIKAEHEALEFECPNCNRKFNRNENFQRHMQCCIKTISQVGGGERKSQLRSSSPATSSDAKKSKNDDCASTSCVKPSCAKDAKRRVGIFKCQNCGGKFVSKFALLAHRRKCHPEAIPNMPLSLSTEECTVENFSSAMSNVHRQILFTPTQDCITIFQFKEQVFETVVNTVRYLIKNGKEVKISFSFSCNMYQMKDGQKINKETVYFNHDSIEFQEGDEEELLDTVFTKVENDIDTFQKRSSGWIIDKVNSLTLAVTKFKRMYGAKGGVKVQLSKILTAKKCTINVACPPDECFKYAVLSAIHVQEVLHRDR